MVDWDIERMGRASCVVKENEHRGSSGLGQRMDRKL